jgi:hypothetical protein
VTLNPEFRYAYDYSPRRFGTICVGHGVKINLEWGPAPIRYHSNLLDTYVSDPPCKKVDVGLRVNFRDRATKFPTDVWVDCIATNLEKGLTIGDTLRAALSARGWQSSSRVSEVKSFLMTKDVTLEEALGRLTKNAGMPLHPDRPLISIDLCLLDDVVTPTPEDLAAIAPRLRHESVPRRPSA